MPSDDEGETPDWILLERWQQGRRDAGEELMRRYLGLLTRFFHNKVSDSQDVADLVSETLLACTRGHEGIRSSKSFRSYVFGVALNQLRRYYTKQHKREIERDDFEQCCVSYLDSVKSTGTVMHQQHQQSLMVQGLRSLPLSYQVVLELSLFEEMSGREIGELLDLPTATVHTRLRRGKEQLALAVERLAQNPEQYNSTITDLEGWARQLRARVEGEESDGSSS
ncbi:RNA polymerase sigma factor [Paraliomyxa miuraensis]|uniref:RNA polymerase sigma factor n=1 Tax=Paraliomyxa miuraensis TaxID=376150 RepID=UPI0022562E78|nr:sigma-70 family RNA polymerase sigma factor [Paraliomyxa miuraensis]MCX4247589.1 sigma-70 family RNA polymerase sigma factor [Paraliomyxa miuraensis]